MKTNEIVKTNNVENQIFQSERFTPTDLENLLWDTMGKVSEGKMKIEQANSVFFGIRDLCLIAKLRLQYRVLSGSHIIPKATAQASLPLKTNKRIVVTAPKVAQQESRSNLRRSHESHVKQLKKMTS